MSAGKLLPKSLLIFHWTTLSAFDLWPSHFQNLHFYLKITWIDWIRTQWSSAQLYTVYFESYLIERTSHTVWVIPADINPLHRFERFRCEFLRKDFTSPQTSLKQVRINPCPVWARDALRIIWMIFYIK